MSGDPEDEYRNGHSVGWDEAEAVYKPQRDEARAEVKRLREQVTTLGEHQDRLRRACLAIQAHGALSANESSMVWTARVALDPSALAFVPPEVREAVAARFPELAPTPESDLKRALRAEVRRYEGDLRELASEDGPDSTPQSDSGGES